MAQQYMEVYSCQGCSNVDDDDMVQCDSCNGWYHYICAGPDITDDVANYDWNCEGCVKYQFSLTLKNKSSDESCKDDNQDSASSECVTSHKDLALDYLEAKKMLDEEQMNKSFEIQRRFLRERFNILRLSDNPVMKQSENVGVCLDKQAQISSKHTRFHMDDVAEFIPGSSTPMRTPSTMIDQTNEVDKQRAQSLTTSCQNKDLFMSNNLELPTTNLHSATVRDKQVDQLYGSTSLFDYHQLTSPSQPERQTTLPETLTSEALGFDNVYHQSKFPVYTIKKDSTFVPVTTVLNPNQIAARHILPKDLPKFNGTPRDWPMFISSYESSTATGGYSNSENLIRLQRSLQGKAMDSVRSILLSPENIPKVIEILRMKYGRPEILIHFMIEEIRDEPPPKLDKLESIINFALTVKNLCSTIEVTKVEAHLNNPYLMQEIVEKLPSSMKLEWSKMKRSLPNVNLITLGDWLYEVAQAASEVVTPCVVPKDKGKNNNNNKKDDNRNKNDRYYVASHKDSDISAISKNSSSNFVPSKCKVCLQTCTKVSNCKKFQNMSVDERWNEVRDKKLCSTCLKSHRRFQCKDKKKCKEIGCGAWHDIMLHKEPVQTSAVHYGLSFSHTVIYRVIPVILYGPSRKIHTYAFLDGGSGITLLEDNLAEYLGIQGEKVSLHLKWTSKIQRSEPDSQRVGLQISDVFGTERYEMNNVRTVRSLELPQQSISKELLEHYSHLDNIPIQTYDKAVSRILIGLENINLMVSLQTAEGKWKEPVATKTRLGWVLQGGPQFYNGNSVHCLPMREVQNDFDLHQLVKNFYSLESFGVRIGVKTEREEVNLSFNSDIERILGMFWKTSMDTFTYSLRFTKLSKGFLNGDKRPTKREVLRTLMTIFDPLGLLAFFLIYAKILLQEIWTSNIGWDDQLTDIQFVKWTTWIEILPEIEKLQIPRLYSRKLSPLEPKSIELHVFVDASELAYAAVAYLRIENDEGVQCVLVGSKTRVAPLKPISIPRLELQAGVLGARYMKYLSKVHTLKINRRVIWTDSRVLLQWLHSEARKYRQFVAFRVGEILELTNIDEWRWVATKDNVADEATKWSKTPVMSTTNRWFNGPDFLREHNNWDMDWSTFEYEENDEEIRLITSHQELLPPEIPNPDRFSKWERILRAQAYVIRAVYNVETIFKFPMSIPLTSEELSLAEKSLFRRAQFDGFGEELAIMQWNKSNSSENPRYVEASSLIAKCSPYLDDEQLIRVHGRIDVMSILNLDTRRPIILPRNHKVSELMIDWYHRRFHHANHETVINEIKQRFYIPRVRVALKSVVSKCQFCKNRRAQPMVPSMADLPAARLTPWTKVFTFTGIDYFGPLLITVKRSTEKRWGVLMTCLSTRAVHIEIVDSLDTESCILAIKDFMALYGHVTDLYCDNGTNFHGSENELRTEFQKMDPAAMHTRFTSPMTTWHFNPPAAAHMGGSWERLIRSIKTSLYHILQDRKPSYKVLKNVLRECQAIVNSRPLTFVAVNDVNAEALTPFHFLIGTSGGVVESCEIPAEEKFIRRNWITSQMLINQFWTRWVREYLPTITRRTRWFRDVKPVEVGDVVYIVDEKLERYSWPRGMVEEVFIGNNGQTRSAKVKVFNSDENKIKIYHRPVSKLAVLDVLTPTENQPSTVSQLENLSSIATPATVHQSTLPSPTLQLPMLDQEGGSGLLSNGITNGENVDDAP